MLKRHQNDFSDLTGRNNSDRSKNTINTGKVKEIFLFAAGKISTGKGDITQSQQRRL